MYERLTREDARKAVGLAGQVAEREAAGYPYAAVRVADELLALRARAQGADHWEVADQRHAVAAL